MVVASKIFIRDIFHSIKYNQDFSPVFSIIELDVIVHSSSMKTLKFIIEPILGRNYFQRL